MKAIKSLIRVLVVILALVVVAVLTLPLWVGPVATGVANAVVPPVTKTNFHLGEFGLNPYTGSVHVGEMWLQNPERFLAGKTEGDDINAISLGAIDVKMSVPSLVTDTIHIQEIVVRDLFIYGDLTFSNIREIVANASGEEEKKPEEKKVEEQKDEGGKKVVIDRVLVTGLAFKWGYVKVPVPDVEIKDIGKDGAVDEEGAFDCVLNAVCAAADQAKLGLGKALKLAIDGGRLAGKAVSAAVDLAVDGAAAVTDAAATAGKAAGEAVGAAAETAGKALGGATDAVTGAAGAAAGAVTGAAEATGKAVGGAVDAVKGLFK